MEKQIRTKVKISDIYFDENLYPRSNYNWNTGWDYAQSIRAGAIFPPIVLAFYKGKKYLVDGKHRTEAYKILKKEIIDAIVFTGWDKLKIFKEAVKYNISHGKNLSPFEKRRIAIKLMEMKCKDSDISKLILVPEDKLENFVSQRLVSSITGEEVSGEEYEDTAKEIGRAVLKSGLKNFAGMGMSREDFDIIQENQKIMSVGSQTSLFKQVINLIQNNLLDKDNKELMALVRKLKKLITKI